MEVREGQVVSRGSWGCREGLDGELVLSNDPDECGTETCRDGESQRSLLSGSFCRNQIHMLIICVLTVWGTNSCEASPKPLFKSTRNPGW